MERSAWAFILLLAASLCWAAPVHSRAQEPPALGATPAHAAAGAQASAGRPGRDAAQTWPGAGLGPKLGSAPLHPSDLPLPINLATALRLSDARPLVVASAQASVWVAEAQLTRAKVLWIPTLMFGFDYIRHDGGGPDFNKGILTAPSVNFFYGGGSLIQ